jgi:hypothetical protein
MCGLLICISFSHADAEIANSQTPSRREQSHVNAAHAALKLALSREDHVAVRSAVASAINALGPQAGRAEIPTRYFPPTDTTPPDLATARAWWLKEIRRDLHRLPWRKNPTGDPQLMRSGLRDAAFALDALARTSLMFPEHRDEFIAHVDAGANWLITLQHSSGVFPFPIGPAKNSNDKVGRIVARNVKQHPTMVVNGWIYDDRGDGGLQFDNALCSRAIINAWKLTGETRWLDAARKSGIWAMSQPLVANWNYTAFSVGLLAELSRATAEPRFLNAAIRKAEVGVLPGQMQSGRWFDPHNASATYHNILMRDLLLLLEALPSHHEFRPKLLDAVERGLNQAAQETLTNGYTGTWTDNFAHALRVIGENARWRDSLHVNLNASGKRGAPNAGTAMLSVLESDQKRTR